MVDTTNTCYFYVFNKLFGKDGIESNYNKNILGWSEADWKNRKIVSNEFTSKIVKDNSRSVDKFYHILWSENGDQDEEGNTSTTTHPISTVDGHYAPNFGTGIESYSEAKTSPQVKAFLSAATEMTIDVKHNITSAEKANPSTYSCDGDLQKLSLRYKCFGKFNGNATKGWSSARWETALYDFKKRKFKCDSVTYSKETGRIVSMVFVEY
jgi:hypothetical protein